MSLTTKTRVLFVDDEPIILELLKAALAMEADQWEASFAASGEEALQLLGGRTFEIVVSDMHMPGISGAQLLNEVMVKYPSTIRVILCGAADREQVLRCVGATHQFLTKPFQLKSLRATLNRFRSLRSRLPDAEILKQLPKRERLPSIPAVYLKILSALEDPECPAQRIGEIVATDPGLTAKILQMVNSAFFGFAREVSNAEEAVMLLGVSNIRALALTAHLFSSFKPVTSTEWSAEQVWNHSIRVGRIARRIAELEEADERFCEQTLTAGLLHDIGQLILAENLGIKYLDLHARARTEARPTAEVEREVLGVNHAEVGGYLLDLWGLPPALVEAVAFHHEPGKNTEPIFSPLTAVHAANALEQSVAEPGGEPLPLVDVDLRYLETLGLAEHLPFWQEDLASFESR
jgi:putative nucleotidyltransferase with HDIG domain